VDAFAIKPQYRTDCPLTARLDAIVLPLPVGKINASTVKSPEPRARFALGPVVRLSPFPSKYPLQLLLTVVGPAIILLTVQSFPLPLVSVPNADAELLSENGRWNPYQHRRQGSVVASPLIAKGLRREERARVQSLFTGSRLGQLGWVDEARWKKAWRDYLDGRSEDSQVLVDVVNVESWLRTFH